jgi:ankyrin repeat protein
MSLNSQALLDHPMWRPAYSLERALQASGSRKAKIILKALRWVAFSLRLLEIDELFSAVVTPTESDCYAIDLRDSSELVELCAYLIVVDDNKRVHFRDYDLRNLILSPERSIMDPCQHTQVHEMIATVCLRHVQCLHRQSIFRPWLLTGDWLRAQVKRCQFWNYSTSFWYEHFRIAEGNSQDLPAILYRILQSAILEHKLELGPGETISDRRINIGLWICSQYDLSVLGRTLLEMGADVDYKDKVGGTPLHGAAANSSANMFKLLLTAGADIDSLDQNGMTALHYSSISGSSDAVSLLLDRGANVDVHPASPARDDSSTYLSGATALHLAAGHGHADVVRLLLRAGSNFNATTRCKETPLHFAAERGDYDTIRHLIECGADPEAENATFETALEIAIEKRHDSIVKFLIERGAKPRMISLADIEYLEKAVSSQTLENALQPLRSLTVQHNTMPLTCASSTYGPQKPFFDAPQGHGPKGQASSHPDNDAWSLVDRVSIKVEIA